MDDRIRNKAVEICRKLQARGFAAGLIGGCVRDALLDKQPKDYDIATSATPVQIKETFADDGDFKAIEIGEAFGIVSLWHKGVACAFEVATFRRDGNYSDGRRPDDVQYTEHVSTDLSRRDFAMNAIYVDPVSGITVDPHGGALDIKNKSINFVGDPMERLVEDRLRLLRAYRFRSQLGFQFAEKTKQAIDAYLDCGCVDGANWVECRQVLNGVSQERITQEFIKILMGDHVMETLPDMIRNGLLWSIIPELRFQMRDHDSDWHQETFANFGTAIISHTLRVVMNASLIIKGDELLCGDRLERGIKEEDRAILLLAALLHDVGKPMVAAPNNKGRTRYLEHDRVGAEMARDILTRMKLPGKIVDAVSELVRMHMRVHDLPKMKDVASIRRLLGRDDIVNLLRLSMCDTYATQNEKDKDGAEVMRAAIQKWSGEFAIMLPEPIITGDDLIEANLRPGPGFKKGLRVAYDEQLRGVSDRKRLLNAAVSTIIQSAE